MSDSKKPRLFYYEEAVDGWVPVPELVENIIDVEDSLEDEEVIEIRFKRMDMTDQEMAELPEV